MIIRSFTPFPILTTERLSLRQLSTIDGQNIFALRSDPEINKYLSRQASKTIEDAINFINKINDSIKKNDAIYWAITLDQNKTFVGTICLFDFSDENDTCEIGYELLPSFQGQGIMKEAASKVIEYAIETMKVKCITAFTHKDNQNSTHLLQQLNFEATAEASPELLVFTLTITD